MLRPPSPFFIKLSCFWISVTQQHQSPVAGHNPERLQGSVLTWHCLELFGQQRLVGVEDPGIGNDHGGADVDLLLPFQDAHAWKQSR